MDNPGRGDPIVFIDITTTTHSQGRIVGAVRVEGRCASALLESHSGRVVPISWSPREERFVALDRQLASRFLNHDGCTVDDISGPPVSVTSGPERRILLVIGAGWISNTVVLQALLKLRLELEAEIHFVIHDVVHLLFPHWQSEEDTARFGSTLETVLCLADRLLVFSDSTERDIRRWMRMRGLSAPVFGRIANAAAAVESSPTDHLTPGIEQLGRSPFVLYVSTLTPRKNHVFICDVWARLAQELGPALPLLVLAGRIPPDRTVVVDRFRRDPALADHLVILPDANDADLAWLYRHCLFTVFPSLYEGWGLPVAESLALGKACLTSSSSSLPEVSAGLVPLLDPLDLRAWCDAIRELVVQPEELARIEERIRVGFRAIGWETVARRVWQGTLAVHERGRKKPALVADGVAHAIPSIMASQGEWKPVRSHAGQITARRTRLGLPLDDFPEFGLRLDLTITCSRGTVRVEVELNGVIVDGCLLADGATTTRTLYAPREALLRRGLLDLVVVARSPSPDEPPLGSPVSIDDVTVTRLTAAQDRSISTALNETWRSGTTRSFAAGSPHVALLREGWGEAAHWGAWSVAENATIRFRLMPQPGDDLIFRAIVRGFVPPARPAVDVGVAVNGVRLATWSFRHPAHFLFGERSVVIPEALLVSDLIHIQLSIPDARSPKELGMGDDQRRLGIGIARAHCSTRYDPQPDPDWLTRRR